MIALTYAYAMARLRLFLRDQRGQAMAEYSTITFAILIGVGATGFAFPWFNGQSLVQAMYSSLQVYVNSVFYSLSLAVP